MRFISDMLLHGCVLTANVLLCYMLVQLSEFWSVYSFVMRPNDATSSLDLQLFRAGVQPMWEDPANREGGRLVLRMRKGLASKIWEETVFAFIGQHFAAHSHVQGIVMSLKPTDDMLSIWTLDANDKEAVASLKSDLVRLLGLPARTRIDYRKHGTTLNKSQKMSRQRWEGRGERDRGDGGGRAAGDGDE